MPLYVADYLGDTGHLSTVEHGAYLLLIMHYWQNGHLPKEDAKLARIARCTPREWATIRDTLAEFFGDRWSHGRIDRELGSAEAAYERRAKAGAKGGKAQALLKRTRSNASAGLKQSQPQPQNYPSRGTGYSEDRVDPEPRGEGYDPADPTAWDDDAPFGPDESEGGDR